MRSHSFSANASNAIYACRQEDTSDWLLTDKTSSWPGSHIDRGWRYLRQALQRHDTADHDFNYSKVTLDTILTYNRAWPTPPWLINFLEVCAHRLEGCRYSLELGI